MAAGKQQPLAATTKQPPTSSSKTTRMKSPCRQGSSHTAMYCLHPSRDMPEASLDRPLAAWGSPCVVPSASSPCCALAAAGYIVFIHGNPSQAPFLCTATGLLQYDLFISEQPRILRTAGEICSHVLATFPSSLQRAYQSNGSILHVVPSQAGVRKSTVKSNFQKYVAKQSICHNVQH